MVDDEDAAREMVAEILADLGYSAITCADGADATKVYREHWREVDAVLLDVIMPNMGGRETFAELRAVNPAVNAIVCSGHSRDGEAQRILEMGAMGFLQKPFGAAELSRAIEEALKR